MQIRKYLRDQCKFSAKNKRITKRRLRFKQKVAQDKGNTENRFKKLEQGPGFRKS